MFGNIKFVAYLCCVLLSFGSSSAAKAILEVPEEFGLENVNEMLAELSPKQLAEGSDCTRTCEEGRRRVCYMEFTVEHFSAMGPACGLCALGVISDCRKPQCLPIDGVEKGIITINRQLPGPSMDVCIYDIVVVNTHNHLHSDTLSFHWHGMLQHSTPYMDGVPFVTQCPITPAASFRYVFVAADAGTYFYHSHSGLQRYNGAYGSFIVHTPKKYDINADSYDFDEHTVIISEWSHEAPEMFMVGLPTRKPGLVPDTLLFNGKGKSVSNASPQLLTFSPYETFYVKSGKRYRFRIINAGATTCPMEFQIEGHRMTIIASDGTNVNPVEVDTLLLTSGERYDVIVKAKEITSGVFWMHIKSTGFCIFQENFQTAVLSYGPKQEDFEEYPSTPRNYQGFPKGVIFNNLGAPCKTSNNVCLTDLKSPETPTYMWSRPADQKHYVTLSNKNMNTTRFFEHPGYNPFLNVFGDFITLATINGVSHMPQPIPFLSQPEDIDYTMFCNPNSQPAHCKDMEICTCTNVIELEENGLVEFILIDESPEPSRVNHPIHMHGYKFAVISEGQFLNHVGPLTVDSIKAYELAGLLNGNNTQPTMKDNIVLRTKGFVVIRLVANNPGYWYVHCHVEDHMVYGMGLVLHNPGPIPEVPANFPRCGNF